MIGMLAVSKAGHDKRKIYVITGEDDEYVYLADGRKRTVAAPKKKNKKHIQIIQELPQETAWYMEQKAQDETEPRRPGLIESLAMTRYYGGLSELTERQRKLCRLYMERFTQKGMVFAHFPGLAVKAGCLSWLENRCLIEYQAEETDRLNIRLQIFPAASPPAQGKMVHVFLGIFAYEVTLFYGEQAEYEIYREAEPEAPVASGTLTAEISGGTEISSPETEGKEEAAEGGTVTRYQAINRLLAKAETQDEGLGNDMMAYGKRLELLERLFRLL